MAAITISTLAATRHSDNIILKSLRQSDEGEARGLGAGRGKEEVEVG